MLFHFPAHNFSGKYHTYAASNKDLHVTFLNEPHVGLQNFSKNVNSAVCTCTVQPTYHPFSNQYYYTYSNYGNHFTDQMRYPWLPYANFLHNRNWFYPSRWRKILKQVSGTFINQLHCKSLPGVQKYKKNFFALSLTVNNISLKIIRALSEINYFRVGYIYVFNYSNCTWQYKNINFVKYFNYN